MGRVNKVQGCARELREHLGEIVSLHAVLKEVEEILPETLLPAQQTRLEPISSGCQNVLQDLLAVVEKYQSLGRRARGIASNMLRS
jgi:hypothetical protein